MRLGITDQSSSIRLFESTASGGKRKRARYRRVFCRRVEQVINFHTKAPTNQSRMVATAEKAGIFGVCGAAEQYHLHPQSVLRCLPPLFFAGSSAAYCLHAPQDAWMERCGGKSLEGAARDFLSRAYRTCRNQPRCPARGHR